ncbi:MAG: DNA repair protein RecO [bacterium]
MPLYQANAMVLRSWALGENDRIISLYTMEFGKIRGVVKGVRRISTRFGSSTLPFTCIKVMFYGNERNELKTISQTEIVKSFQGIRDSLEGILYGSVLLELTEHLINGTHQDERIFRLILKYLTWLEHETKGIILYSFCFKLLCMLGFRPSLSNCVVCHQVSPVIGNKIWFSREDGGIICPACLKERQGAISVPYEVIELTKRLISERVEGLQEYPVSAQLIEEMKSFTLYFLSQYLASPIKSIGFIEELLKDDNQPTEQAGRMTVIAA